MEESPTWPLREDGKKPNFTTLSRLTIFLSWIGIHRFYVGEYKIGTLLIILFSISFTFDGVTKDPQHAYYYHVLLVRILSTSIQVYDLFKVCFGLFRDEQQDTIALRVDESVPSNVQLGPLLIWACFLGVLGAHNFYAKKYKNACLQLITLGGFGIWAIYEIFVITKGEFRDTQGHRVGHIYTKDPHMDVQA